ncbi:MAG: alpha-(1-_6)-mannopyranosyltransferase A [Corynebacterium sp.]|nr:alpha-(1->6)-mannopyranosyltransferase A [Corynebacterium sp.]
MKQLVFRAWQRFLGWNPRALGLIATCLMMLGSFGGGAVRNRGGLLQVINLEFLAFGHGAGFSNVTFWIGSVTFICAWFLLGRKVVARVISLRELRRIVAIWIVPLIFAAPFMSRDVYSYLMQGALLRDGFDPYTQGPAVNPGAYLFEVSHDWRNTTTPYGPLHLWIGKAITHLTGDSVTLGIACFKVLSLAGFAAIAWAVPRIAQELGGNPLFAFWLGVANPVMVFHLIGGMHNESIMVGLVSIGIYWCLRRSVPNFIAAVGIIALAMSLKATAALVLPFVVWIALTPTREEHPNNTALLIRRFIYFAAGGAAITIAVLALVTWCSGSNWGWIAALTGNSKVINPLAFPSLVTSLISSFGGLWIEPFPYNSVLTVVRSISMLIMAVGLVWCWWKFRRTPQAAIQGATAAYCVAFFFNAVTLPWYYSSILALVGTFRSPRWVRTLAIGGSIVVALAFSGGGNHQLYNPVWMTASGIAAWIFTRHLHAVSASYQHPASGEHSTPATAATDSKYTSQ